MDTDEHFAGVHSHIQEIMPKIERPAQGYIKYPYLVVSYGAAYSGLIYLWDHHHMAMRFAHDGRPEYLKYQAENCFHYQDPDGFVPNCIHADWGPRNSFTGFHAQPFLAQGAELYLSRTGELEWAAAAVEKLARYLGYYEARCRTANSLFCWPKSFMSGFDNDAASTFFMPGEIITADLSSWIVLEYRAMARIHAALGDANGEERYRQKADELAARINEVLWFEEAQSYSAWNVVEGRHLFSRDVGRASMAGVRDREEGTKIGAFAFQTCSNLIPLYAGVASQERAAKMIETYVISERHFLSTFGIRSLSRQSEYYNNAKWGNPPRFYDYEKLSHSNWQGPVWIPLCYFMYEALRKYGYEREAKDLARQTIRVLAMSLESLGSFTENLDAESGEPLYAEKFASWNILADLMVR